MAHRSDPRLLVLHGLRLKGFAEPPAVAAVVGLDPGDVDARLADLQDGGLVLRREGRVCGWSLTATGRKEHERLLADELDAVGCRDVIDDAYRRFLGLNPEMLSVCTAWQMREVDGQQVINDHADAAYDDEVVGRLVGIHDRVRPVATDLREQLDRFGGYGARLRGALERLVAGERDYFTKPVIDSYHTIWFELHEDLLATLGIERAKEGEA